MALTKIDEKTLKDTQEVIILKEDLLYQKAQLEAQLKNIDDKLKLFE